MYATMNFLETCTSQELENVEWELNDLMNDFSDKNGEGEFIDFLEELGERESESLLESVREFKNNKEKNLWNNKTYFLLFSNRAKSYYVVSRFFLVDLFFLGTILEVAGIKELLSNNKLIR